jgi:hypothetical protein
MTTLQLSKLGNFQTALLGRIRPALTAFGWIKTIAGLRKTRFIGRARTDWAFTFAAAAYNLVRLPRLMAEAAG